MEENQNWKDNFRSSLKTINDLSFFEKLDSNQLAEVLSRYGLFIPRKLAKKIKEQGFDGPLARQFLPHQDELAPLQQLGLHDPIGDKKYLKAPQLIHRYTNRVLFTPTAKCPVNCRYCFRKNEINDKDDLFDQNFEQTLHYLKEHTEISEVIFTGGDPFTLSNDKIQYYLNEFSHIKHIKDIRFHSRYPVIMPERFDQELLAILEGAQNKFRTISLAVHSNHHTEFDDENSKCIKKLSQTGIQLLSQTVLLKSVNDKSEDLLKLMNQFLELKIRPYYLHHPDQVKGALHFYLNLEEGRRLYAQLRGHLPGWAIPHYIIDIPGGEGKVSAFNPESFSYSGHLLSVNSQIIPVKEPQIR